MDIQRIEELLRTRPPRERTYDRPPPTLTETARPLRATVRARGGSPIGLSAAAVALVLVLVAGAVVFGGWRNGQPGVSEMSSTSPDNSTLAASPGSSTPTAPVGLTTVQPRVLLSFGTDDLASLVLGPDGAAYILDNTVHTVYWVSLQTGARMPVLTAGQGPFAGSGVVGNPRLMTTGGQDVLILDSFNSLWRWRPAAGDATGRGTLIKVDIPDSSTWGSGARAIGTSVVNPQIGQYNFYVVVPSQRQVLMYPPAADFSGYPTAGRVNYLAVARDVSSVDDMYVDGGVYLVDGGKITGFKYEVGQAVGGWSPADPSGPTPYYTHLTADNPAKDQGTCYAFDRAGERIVAFKKSDGSIVGQYIVPAGTPWLTALTGMFVTTEAAGTNPKLYWTESGNLMTASLEPSSAPTRSASSSAKVPPLPNPSFQMYTVKPGDNLQSIASRLGLSLWELELANPQIHDFNYLQVGWLLEIPPPGLLTPAPASPGPS